MARGTVLTTTRPISTTVLIVDGEDANRSRTRRAPPRNHPPTQRRPGKPRPVRSRL